MVLAPRLSRSIQYLLPPDSHVVRQLPLHQAAVTSLPNKPFFPQEALVMATRKAIHTAVLQYSTLVRAAAGSVDWVYRWGRNFDPSLASSEPQVSVSHQRFILVFNRRLMSQLVFEVNRFLLTACVSSVGSSEGFPCPGSVHILPHTALTCSGGGSQARVCGALTGVPQTFMILLFC